MNEQTLPRTWKSTCRDCAHFKDFRCEMQEPTSGPKDGYASICRLYRGKSMSGIPAISQEDAASSATPAPENQHVSCHLTPKEKACPNRNKTAF